MPHRGRVAQPELACRVRNDWRRWPAMLWACVMSADFFNETALVLFSGGQDSATCLAWALSRFGCVETLGFHYGQRHAIELDCRAALRDGRLDTNAEGGVAIESFLTESDLVKFADFAPTESAVDSVMRAARGIVELTRAPEAPAAQPEAAS